MRVVRIAILALAAALAVVASIAFLIGGGQLVRTMRGPEVPAIEPGLSPHRTQVVFFRDAVLANEHGAARAQVNAFEAFTRELYWRSNALSDDRLTLEMLRAMALFDNAHSTIIEPRFRRVPLRFHWFSDGLYVVKASPDLVPVAGARVMAIEGHDPEEIFARLRAFIPGVEGWQRYRSEYFLSSPGVLAALGVSTDPAAMVIDYARPGSLTRSLAVGVEASVPEGDAFREFRHLLPGDESFGTKGWIRAGDAVAVKPTYLQGLPSPFASAFLPELNAVYVRLNGSNSTREVDLPDFLARVVAEVESRHAANAIVDLRFDWGGNYMLARSFAPRLASAIPANGRVFVITGPNTFSAGLITAARIKRFAGSRTVIVGEPAGDRLRFRAEGLEVQLPVSGVDLYLSTASHDLVDGCRWLDRECFILDKFFPAAAGDLTPALPASSSFADFMAGRDPAMDRIRQALRP
jgi:hypothetical protein